MCVCVFGLCYDQIPNHSTLRTYVPMHSLACTGRHCRSFLAPLFSAVRRRKSPQPQKGEHCQKHAAKHTERRASARLRPSVPFVVPQVEIRLAAIVKHVDLP